MIKRNITRKIPKQKEVNDENLTSPEMSEDIPEVNMPDIEEEMFDKSKKKKPLPPPEIEVIEEPKEEPPVQEEQSKPLTPPQSPVKEMPKAKPEQIGGRDVIYTDEEGNKLSVRRNGKVAICPCGNTIKNGSPCNMKKHFNTALHKDRMTLINEGKNPNEHHDWLYRAQIEKIKKVSLERSKVKKVATAKLKNKLIDAPVEPIRTEYEGEVKMYQPPVRNRGKKVEIPQYEDVPDDFEERVNKEVERRYKIKREREEREAQLVREAEERVRKEFEERYSKPALPTKTMQNPVFNRSSAFAQRNRRFGY